MSINFIEDDQKNDVDSNLTKFDDNLNSYKAILPCFDNSDESVRFETTELFSEKLISKRKYHHQNDKSVMFSSSEQQLNTKSQQKNFDILSYNHESMTLGQFVAIEHSYNRFSTLISTKSNQKSPKTSIIFPEFPGRKTKLEKKPLQTIKKGKIQIKIDTNVYQTKLPTSNFSLSNSKEGSKKSSFENKTKKNLKIKEEKKLDFNQNYIFKRKSSVSTNEENEKFSENEMDQSINELGSTPQSGRSQRVRKKPKRWDNDEVEVDFGGKLNISTRDSEQTLVRNKNNESNSKKRKLTSTIATIKKEPPKEEPSSNESSSSDDEKEDESNDSSFDSDDDPEKLWCLCRKPYDQQFMIGCDSCEEWFHGKCVGVSKIQGRKMEKMKQEWFCQSCVNELANGFSRQELKEAAQIKRQEMEKKEKETRLAKKKTAKEDSLSKAKQIKTPTKGSINHHQNDNKDPEEFYEDEEKPFSPSSGEKFSKQQNHSRKSLKEEEEKLKLKKLIKASKKDLIVKKEKLKIKTEQFQENAFEQHSNFIPGNIESASDSSSNLVNHSHQFSPSISDENRNLKSSKTEKSKKHKLESIDSSLQDLFKAEPVLVRSMSSSSTSAVSPSISQSNQRKSSDASDSQASFGRRHSSSSSCSTPIVSNHESILCPNQLCRKSMKINSEQPIKSIYCSSICLQTYITETLRQLRSRRSNFKEKLKLSLIDRLSGKVILVKEISSDREVFDLITKNQTSEILKDERHQSKSSMLDGKNSGSKKSLSTSTTTNNNTSKSNEVKKSQAPSTPRILERTSSTSEKPSTDSDRRKFVCNALKEILNSRYNELSASEKSKVSNGVDVEKLSAKIENELFKIFKSTNNKYNNKSRSLIFNLKDQKNTLYRKVLLGKIKPDRLANMTAEELASTELARWREKEKKSMIELITRDAVDQANQVIVKKTHKGEELIENELLIPISVSADLSVTKTSNEPDLELPLAGTATEIVKNDSSEQPSLTTVVTLKNNEITSTNKPTSVGVVDILDTTAQHKSHVFSNNCKICTQQTPVEETHQNNSNIINKSLSQTSIKESEDGVPQKSQPKRVRVELDLANKFLEEAFKNSELLKEKGSLLNSSTINNPSLGESTSPIVSKVSTPPNSEKIPSGGDSSAIKVIEVWKGIITMQDVAKFVAKAQVVSGHVTNSLAQELPEQISVCGRITPEQALDYLGKLKQAKRADIGLIRFVWASREERTGYDAFYNYLDSRHRYAVIGLSGNTIKDFYILPLSSNNDLPKIFQSLDGPGIEKRNHRPNLLLGIIVRSKKQSTSISHSSSTSIVSLNLITTQDTPPVASNERSYTPPLGSTTPPTLFDHEDDEEDDDDARSYTPPRQISSSKRISLDNHQSSYEPSSKMAKKSETIFNETAKNDVSSSKNVADFNDVSIFKDIQIPENLKDILKTVQSQAQTPVLNPPSKSEPSDPRLRPGSKILTKEIGSAPATEPVAASMSQDELLRKAHEQMAALAQMEHHNPQSPAKQTPQMMSKTATTQAIFQADSTAGVSGGQKISFQWKKKK